jgi:hypothetical protein
MVVMLRAGHRGSALAASPARPCMQAGHRSLTAVCRPCWNKPTLRRAGVYRSARLCVSRLVASDPSMRAFVRKWAASVLSTLLSWFFMAAMSGIMARCCCCRGSQLCRVADAPSVWNCYMSCPCRIVRSFWPCTSPKVA